MEFEPEESALIESYLHTRAGPNRTWLMGLALGAVVCLAALLMLALARGESLSFALLALVAGLVVMARALDERRKTILASIIQKYHRGAGDAE